jgi:hypothetical protein
MCKLYLLKLTIYHKRTIYRLLYLVKTCLRKTNENAFLSNFRVKTPIIQLVENNIFIEPHMRFEKYSLE